MKPIPFLVALVVFLCWSPAQGVEDRAPKQKPQVHKLSAAAFSDTFEKPEWFFLLDGVIAHRSLDGLKEAVGKIISAGSPLKWEGSDVGVTPEAFSSPEKLKAFEDYCAALGVRFVVVPAG